MTAKTVLKPTKNEDTKMKDRDDYLKAADWMAIPDETFTEEELAVSPAFLARCRDTATQAHALRQLQLAHRTDAFMPVSVQHYLQLLAEHANVPLQPVLDWWEIDFTFKQPTAAVAWAELAQAIGIESHKAELYGRIGLAQQANPNGWKTTAAHYANGLDEAAALQVCEAALRQLEHGYLDAETRALRQLKSAISRVYERDENPNT